MTRPIVPFTERRKAMTRPDSRQSEGLDVRRVVQAITNIALRHGVSKDPPIAQSLMSIYGYTTAPATMDAEIAAEYAALAATPEPTLDAERLAEALIEAQRLNREPIRLTDKSEALLLAEWLLARLHERTEP